MKTIISSVFAVLAVSAAALAIADSAKAGTVVPSVHVMADAPVPTIDLGANVVHAMPRKRPITATPHTAVAQNAKHMVCGVRGLASDYAAQVRTCEWL